MRSSTDKIEVGAAIVFHIPEVWTVAVPPEDRSLNLNLQ